MKCVCNLHENDKANENITEVKKISISSWIGLDLLQEIEALKNKFRKVEEESSVVKLDNIYEKMITQVAR